MASILLLNGPNLNLLGEREPETYGSTTLSEIEDHCRNAASAHGLDVECRQSNHEGQLIDWIHAGRKTKAAVIINPAGLGFTSMALMDALKAVSLPVIEVHISNIHRRESMYHKSLISTVAVGVICGLGTFGYEMAIRFAAHHLAAAKAAGT